MVPAEEVVAVEKEEEREDDRVTKTRRVLVSFKKGKYETETLLSYALYIVLLKIFCGNTSSIGLSI